MNADDAFTSAAVFNDRSSLLHIKQLFDDWVSYKRTSLPPFVAHEYFLLLVDLTSGNPKKILRKNAVGLSFRSRLDEPPGRISTNWIGAVPGFCCQLFFRLWLEMRPRSHCSVSFSCWMLWILSIAALPLCPRRLHRQTSG